MYSTVLLIMYRTRYATKACQTRDRSGDRCIGNFLISFTTNYEI